MQRKTTMAKLSGGNTFFSLGVLPFLMALGHLSPTIGASQIATGTYQFPGALLGMLTAATTLVDSLDTYKDIPLDDRPRKWVWRLWVYSLWTITLVCTLYCGLQPAIQMYRFAFIGLGWGTPCLPFFSHSSGFLLLKPKTILREAKSLTVAVCMTYVTAETSMFYFCHNRGQCTESSLRTKTILVTAIYQFIRETACDIRDIEEDTKYDMKTLPVRLGKRNTMFLVTFFGMLLDTLTTKGVVINGTGIHVNLTLLLESIVRVGVTMFGYTMILKYPKGHNTAWGLSSLLGLVPILWAQATLVKS